MTTIKQWVWSPVNFPSYLVKAGCIMLIKCFSICESLANDDFKLISPKPFSVVRSDILRFQIAPLKKGIQIDSAFLNLATDQEDIEHRSRWRFNEDLIHVLDCRPFHDGRVYYQAEIWQDGSRTVLGKSFISGEHYMFMLDRREELNAKNCGCQHTSSKMAMDKMSGSFAGHNNQITFKCLWDQDSLYLSIRVEDEHLNHVTGEKENLFYSFYNSDGIEISFDFENNKSEWRHHDDFEVYTDIKTNYQASHWDDQLENFENWGEAQMNIEVDLKGTLNDNLNVDSGYVVKFSAPWEAFHIDPSSGQKIGFDLQNFDRDITRSTVNRSSWSRTLRGNNDNTSEWGTLILEKPVFFTYKAWWLLLIIPVLMVILGERLFKKQRKSNTDEQRESPILIQKIDKIIETDYANVALDVNGIARILDLSIWHVSSVYKEHKGRSLKHELNRFRIEKSCDLIKHSSLNISEISYKVGFSTIQSFNNNFKKIKNITPSEYRKKHGRF